MIRIAVLISGRGSNMLRLAEVAAASQDDMQIVLVAANTPCDGLEAAASHNLPTQLVDRQDHASKSAHESALAACIEAANADWIVLAGYMAILSADFINRFRNRIINIHPSLLPELKGLDTHARALDAGHSRHGASVHIVTPLLDDGPILLQASLQVDNGETETQLAARVLTLEHALYPFVMTSLARGVLKIDDGVPQWHQGPQTLAQADASIASVLTPAIIWP